jgi:hypothetical protein
MTSYELINPFRFNKKQDFPKMSKKVTNKLLHNY